MADGATKTRPTRSTLPDGEIVLRSDRFTLIVKRLAPGTILLTAIGYEDGATFELLKAELDKELARAGDRGLTIFCDLAEETGMAADSREKWGQWAKDTRRAVSHSHILVRSRLVDMAISLIGLFVGGGNTHSYTDPVKFEAALLRAVPGLREQPRYPDLVAERAARGR